MAKLPWKPWHEVVQLRDDLKSGELPMHMFAADLNEVMLQQGKRPVYENPEHFFALTFPTYNLRQLVRDVVLRLSGKNDKAVRQLALTYGGGKTHTLITLRHLVHDPEHLPDLSAVAEFEQAIGRKPPKCRVAAICFDKLDVEKGMEVRAPDGSTRQLKNPWSVLAYQLAGDEGLKLLHADNKAEERDSAPSESVLTQLLELPQKENLGVLVLLDEVLMYAREKVALHQEWLSKLQNFFQCLTQAATKADRCCIVVSLLASDTSKNDRFGREIDACLQDIFQRQREEVVEPVVKEDVAEVLRRRFFKPDSIKNKDLFRQHVVAALKGIADNDEQTSKQGAEAEDRFFKSYPFHPDLTEVFYSKWTTLSRFQRTRGILRTFALALREGEKWDTSPLVGASVFLTAPEKEGLSEAIRELVSVADSEESEGARQAWSGILDNEFVQARRIQQDAVGLKNREIEQAVVSTFLHSQPIGQCAHTRDLIVLIASGRPDKIELEKGLKRWVQTSYWLDDQYTGTADGQLPSSWRLGNRPNLNQMHANAVRNIAEYEVKAKLIDDIAKLKDLTGSAYAAGVRVHMLPERPKDVEDDGLFHYVVLGLSAASESGKPSAEARRFLEETTGPERPRVYRNSLLLLTPSKDGLELALASVRDYLAWEVVLADVKKQQKDGNVDVARANTLRINIDKAKARIPDAIRQAYSIVCTVSERNELQAFKITIIDETHFVIIKNDKRSRLTESAITADALLPDGPYNLWRPGETARRVKDLSGAFAQLPHLPKMLKASAILDTLAQGCEQGIFVLRLTRPDGTSRSWWMSRPDEIALKDTALELVLPEAATLTELPAELLEPQKLPSLWTSDTITVEALYEYFKGQTTVQTTLNGYTEPLLIPKAEASALEAAIASAVEKGYIWFVSGPASILGEPIPTGLLSPESKLCVPPGALNAAALLPENLPGAWKAQTATALSIATALSVKEKKNLPWKTIESVIQNALNARFIELATDSQSWPCDYATAKFVKLAVSATAPKKPEDLYGTQDENPIGKIHLAEALFSAHQIQDLGDVVSKLTEIKTKYNTDVRFYVRIEIGDGEKTPPIEALQKVNAILKDLKADMQVKY